MSVDKSKRTEDNMATLTKATELWEHTIKVTSNANNFPKRYFKSVTQYIIEDARTINAYVYQANAIYVKTPDDYKDRRRFQVLAHAKTFSLESQINMAKRVFGLEKISVKFWTGLLKDERRLIQNWIRSEETRYAAHLEALQNKNAKGPAAESPEETKAAAETQQAPETKTADGAGPGA